MKKLLISTLVVVGFIAGANSATPQQRRGGTSNNTATNSAAGANTAARAAVSARSGTRAPTAGTQSNQVAARAATAGRTTVSRGSNDVAPTTVGARSATVAARAGVTQKVIGTGTKVAAAAKNVVVSEACQQKYDGCMDAFCMVENTSGGRCICSDRNAELDSILAEIEKLDQQSYQMATVGVEKIEMGSDADAAIANANAVASSLIKKDEEEKSKRKTLDMSMWDVAVDFSDSDVFNENEAIEEKTGDALHTAAHNLCAAQMPECGGEMSLLQMMYSQRIKSDCSAYENSLKQQKNSSQQKLNAAERALREAALEQLRTANKYDLGQCTIEFKKCMATTAGCKDDFTGCVGIAAAENAKSSFDKKASMKMYDIKGSATKISIAASSYDALESKKPMCMSVTNSCVAVKDQVWDTFLREVAPQIKTAELLAESDLRMSCISNISQCFQKACKDTMDPNDPEGSYDMCLSRPETVRSLCRVQIDPCEKAEPLIMDFVYARLASMRVDSCTKEVKECLQSDDRCGKDYSQCVGLDTDTIMRMCPYDKLVGCQQVYGETNIRGQEVYDELANMVQGIMLNIDNNMYSICQKAADEAMIKVCGDTESCNAFDTDELIGTESLFSHKENSGDYVIEGLVSFGNIKVSENSGKEGEVAFGPYEIDINNYKSHLNDSDFASSRVVEALQSTANKINQKIAILSQDNTVQMCIKGRTVAGVTRSANGDSKGATGRSEQYARFPHLLDSYIMLIMASGLDRAKTNYTAKYDEMVKEALEEQNDSIKQAMCAAMATNPRAEPVCQEYTATGACKTYKSSDPFLNLFEDTGNAGISASGESYAVRQVINGVSLEKSIQAASSGKGEFLQTDNYGNLLASITITAAYSAQNNTCTLTTRTLACESAQKVSSTVRVNKAKKGTEISVGGISVNATNKTIHNLSISEYKGMGCTKWAEPVINTQSIKM